jgi:hypothetical protein
MTSRIPSPVAQWTEPPLSGAAGVISRMAAYKTTAGYWIVLPASATPPAGALAGGLVHGASYDTLGVAAVSPLRVTRNPRGFLFLY